MTIDRRTLLLGAGATAALVALPGPAQAATKAASDPKTWSADRSDNGWPIDANVIEPFRIEGSAATVRLHPGAAAILLHVARRWHYEVSPLRGSRDVLGHRTDRAVRTAFESNHLSGTAITLLDAGDGLWPHQRAIVRDILADCDGVVRWGADLSPAAECHFQIDVGPDARALTRLTAALRDRSVKCGGPRPGAPEDPAAPERRAKARRLAQAQRGN